MTTDRLRSVTVQREALLTRIAEARERPSADFLVPQMLMALEALDALIAREETKRSKNRAAWRSQSPHPAFN